MAPPRPLEVLDDDDYLRQYDGVITLTQARCTGGPGVYFVEDRPFTDFARIRVAV